MRWLFPATVGLLASAGAILLVWPESAGLLGYALATMWATGPISPLIPGGYEALTMVVGRLHPPLLVAIVGSVANLYVEAINYHVYGAAVRHSKARALRENRGTRWLRAVFERRPFLAIWLCAWSPIPYWIVGFLAPMAGYPLRPYLAATFLGRFPRFFLFAALGRWWRVDSWLLLGFACVAIAGGGALWLVRRAERRTLDPLPRPGGILEEGRPF